MGPKPPGKAAGPSLPQLYRQLQYIVNEAMRTLDAAQPDDPANQADVEGLRKLVWSELTGLEAEFGREDGPRTDRANRFFSHLLSNGNYVGQIEALGGALLGGQPPPTRPDPDSPVAGLHALHSLLMELQQQWQQLALPAEEQVPTVARQSDWRPSPAVEESRPAQASPPTQRRQMGQPTPARTPRRLDESTGFLESLGFRRGRSLEQWSADAPRPRVMLTFVVVFVVLFLMGIGVIYLGLSSSSDTTGGTSLNSPNGTVTVEPLPSGAATPTATINPAAPVLTIIGSEPILVPCPTSGLVQGTFFVKNTGGQTLTWAAHANPIASSRAPVTLDPPGGTLFGAEETNSVLVTITAQVASGSGTITITTNANSRTISYQIVGC